MTATETCFTCKEEVRAYQQPDRAGLVSTVWLHPHGSPLGPHRAVLGTGLTPEKAEELWQRVRERRIDHPLPDDPDDEAGGQPEALPEHPAPEVPARPATDEEIPRGARSLINAAKSLDWQMRVTYARGVPTDAAGHPATLTVDEPVIDPETGEQTLTEKGKGRVKKIKVGPKVVDCVTVLFWRGPASAMASWEDGKLRSASRLAPDAKMMTSTELRTWFREAGWE